MRINLDIYVFLYENDNTDGEASWIRKCIIIFIITIPPNSMRDFYNETYNNIKWVKGFDV
jgi:hypothetical protein